MRTVLSKDAVAIAISIIFAGLLVSGAILYTAPRKDEASYLRAELIKTEALMETALKTLHHERLYHGTKNEMK